MIYCRCKSQDRQPVDEDSFPSLHIISASFARNAVGLHTRIRLLPLVLASQSRSAQARRRMGGVFLKSGIHYANPAKTHLSFPRQFPSYVQLSTASPSALRRLSFSRLAAWSVKRRRQILLCASSEFLLGRSDDPHCAICGAFLIAASSMIQAGR